VLIFFLSKPFFGALEITNGIASYASAVGRIAEHNMADFAVDTPGSRNRTHSAADGISDYNLAEHNIPGIAADKTAEHNIKFAGNTIEEHFLIAIHEQFLNGFAVLYSIDPDRVAIVAVADQNIAFEELLK
jgi:hypothetical protein